MRYSVIFLPGIIAPGAQRYGPLVERLPDARTFVRDLAVYDGETPPADYSIATEVDALERFADAERLERFHLFGHSAGGAVGLAYAVRHGDRLVSLSVDEPASDFTADGNAELEWPEYDAALALPTDEVMGAFMRLQVADDVTVPPRPDGPPPAWMAKRPAGVVAFVGALRTHRIDAGAYRRFRRPVYFSRGDRTRPRWAAMQERLGGLFPDFTGDVFAGLHHLDPAHQARPGDVAAIMTAFWERAEALP